MASGPKAIPGRFIKNPITENITVTLALQDTCSTGNG
jgi:hypothetical protein